MRHPPGDRAPPRGTDADCLRRAGAVNRTADSRYQNSLLADEFLVPGRPRYFGGWVTMAARREYPAWMRLTDAVRTNRPVTWDPDQRQSLFDPADPLLANTFWEAMHALSVTTSEAVADVIDLSDVTSLLDVGRGSAAYDITLCSRHPRLSATVLDLPFVCDLAAEKIDRAGLGDRITLVPGDFLTSELPTGHDAILLSGILHDWNEEDCRLIVDRCLRALRPGGRLFVVDLMVNDIKDGPPDAALMSVNMTIPARTTINKNPQFLLEIWLDAPNAGRNSQPKERSLMTLSTTSSPCAYLDDDS